MSLPNSPKRRSLNWTVGTRKLIFSPPAKTDFARLIRDDRVTLFGHAALDPAILELVPVGRVGIGSTLCGLARNAQPHEHPELRLLPVLWRLGSPVVHMAMRATVLVERRAEPPHAIGLGRYDPSLVELLFALDECLGLLFVEHRNGHREGVGTVIGSGKYPAVNAAGSSASELPIATEASPQMAMSAASALRFLPRDATRGIFCSDVVMVRSPSYDA